MKIAEDISNLSKSRRKKVGALIIRDNHIVAEGYNGTVQGQEPDILEYYIPYKNDIPNHLKNEEVIDIIECPVCKGSNKIGYSTYTKPIKCTACEGQGKLKIFNKTNHGNTFHAEANLLMFCAKKGISTEGADMYVTLSPCIGCANLILQAGIKRLFYKECYRDTSGLDKLKKFIDVVCINN